MVYNKLTNDLGEAFVRAFPEIKPSFLDANNIVWKIVGDKYIGKRSVCTFDNRVCWLEETTKEKVKTWLCGIDADYNEVFTA